ncbi:MAG: hypothetical protein ABI608_05045 [Rhizomicrobium sp.]
MKTVSISKRVGGMLCVALMFVFSQAAVASSVGSVQHLFAGEHHHMMFSDITVDYGHHDDGDHHDQDRHHDHQPDADDTAPDGHAVGHHHHHGDVGSSLLVLGGTGSVLLPAWGDTQRPGSDRLIVNARQFLPERPPKDDLSRV